MTHNHHSLWFSCEISIHCQLYKVYLPPTSNRHVSEKTKHKMEMKKTLQCQPFRYKTVMDRSAPDQLGRQIPIHEIKKYPWIM